MPKVTYIEADGTRHLVDLELGRSLMEGARDNAVNGIPADCGGACSCSTCHMHVDPTWADRLPRMEEMEADMLDFAQNVIADVSRLSCQIRMTPDLDGVIFHIP